MYHFLFKDLIAFGVILPLFCLSVALDTPDLTRLCKIFLDSVLRPPLAELRSDGCVFSFWSTYLPLSNFDLKL